MKTESRICLFMDRKPLLPGRAQQRAYRMRGCASKAPLCVLMCKQSVEHAIRRFFDRISKIPDRVDTVLLDITLLGATISTHLTKLAARLHTRGIDLVVWSSLSKLTQGGKNSGGGGFVAHHPLFFGGVVKSFVVR